MMRIGMGTPSSHKKIQPTFPACSLKRAATMTPPPSNLSGHKATAVPRRHAATSTRKDYFCRGMGTAERLVRLRAPVRMPAQVG